MGNSISNPLLSFKRYNCKNCNKEITFKEFLSSDNEIPICNTSCFLSYLANTTNTSDSNKINV